jgi:hypothetical protein
MQVIMLLLFFVADVIKEFGQIDGVNNAGISKDNLCCRA